MPDSFTLADIIQRALESTRGEIEPLVPPEELEAPPLFEDIPGVLEGLRGLVRGVRTAGVEAGEAFNSLVGLDPLVAAAAPQQEVIKRTEVFKPEKPGIPERVGEFLGEESPAIIGGAMVPLAGIAGTGLQAAAEEAVRGRDALDVTLGAIGGMVGGAIGQAAAKFVGRGARDVGKALPTQAAVNEFATAQSAVNAFLENIAKGDRVLFRKGAEIFGASPSETTQAIARAGGDNARLVEEFQEIIGFRASKQPDVFMEDTGIRIALEEEVPELSPRLERMAALREAGVQLGRPATPSAPQPRQMLLGQAEPTTVGVEELTPELSPRLTELAERRAAGLRPSPRAGTKPAPDVEIHPALAEFAQTDPAKFRKAVGRLVRGRPFAVKGGTQFRLDRDVRRSMAGLNRDAQQEVIFGTEGFPDRVGVQGLTPTERTGIALRYNRALKALANQLTEGEPKTLGRVSKALGKMGTTRSGLTGDEGFLMVGRLAEDLPAGMKIDLDRAVKKIDKAPGAKFRMGENWFYNSLLSTPKFVWNQVIGNGVQAISDISERGTRGLLSGNVDQAIAQFGGMHGFAQAMRVAGKNFVRAFQAGHPRFLGADPAIFFNRAAQQAEGAVVGPEISARGGNIVFSAIPRLAGALDDFFTTMGFHMEKLDQVYRRAWNSTRGMKGKTRRVATENQIRSLMQNTPPDIDLAAMNGARRAVFRDLPQEPFSEGLIGIGELVRKQFPVVGRFAVPFARIPVNLAKRGLEYTPWNVLNALRHGVVSANPEQAARQGIRAMMGTMAMGYTWYLAQNGLVTGDWDHLTDGQRAVLLKEGKKSNAFKWGNKWISYRNLGPLSVLFNIPANVVERHNAGQEWGEAITKGLTIDTVTAVADATFIPATWELLAGFFEPERYGGRAVDDIIRLITAQVLPLSGLIGQVVRAVDPTVRRPATTEVLEREGLSPLLAPFRGDVPRLGLFGEEIQREGAFGAGPLGIFLSPAQASRVTSDPLIIKIAELSQDFPEVTFTAPTVVEGRLGLEKDSLTEDEKFQGAKAKGMLQRQFASRVFNSPAFARMPKHVQARVLKKAVGRASRVINARIRRIKKDGGTLTLPKLIRR